MTSRFAFSVNICKETSFRWKMYQNVIHGDAEQEKITCDFMFNEFLSFFPPDLKNDGFRLSVEEVLINNHCLHN